MLKKIIALTIVFVFVSNVVFAQDLTVGGRLSPAILEAATKRLEAAEEAAAAAEKAKQSADEVLQGAEETARLHELQYVELNKSFDEKLQSHIDAVKAAQDVAMTASAAVASAAPAADREALMQTLRDAEIELTNVLHEYSAFVRQTKDKTAASIDIGVTNHLLIRDEWVAAIQRSDERLAHSRTALAGYETDASTAAVNLAKAKRTTSKAQIALQQVVVAIGPGVLASKIDDSAASCGTLDEKLDTILAAVQQNSADIALVRSEQTAAMSAMSTKVDALEATTITGFRWVAGLVKTGNTELSALSKRIEDTPLSKSDSENIVRILEVVEELHKKQGDTEKTVSLLKQLDCKVQQLQGKTCGPLYRRVYVPNRCGGYYTYVCVR